MGARGEALEGEAVAVEGPGVEGFSVEGDRAQFGGLQLNEGVRGLFLPPYGEVDDGTGVEGLVATREVECDLVAVDVEEPSTGLRFVARQYGHEGHAA